MKFHVTVKTFDSITGDEDVKDLRQKVGQKVQEFQQSGKMLHGGVLLEKRGAYFVFDVDSEEELFNLITPMQDYSNIEMHPIVSFEVMEKFFRESGL